MDELSNSPTPDPKKVGNANAGMTEVQRQINPY
jgi:hypothetical protein